VLRYADGRRGQRRSMRLVPVGAARRLEAFLLGGDTRAESWIRPLVQDALPAQAYGRHLLLAGDKPPVATAPAARQICACHNVSDSAIRGFLAACGAPVAERLGQLQSALKCGTQCGSCVPELKRLVLATPLRQAMSS
jgi:assimilatory nitrate reductase catalytic subunit